MPVTVTVDLHCGGRENTDQHEITFELPAEARTVLFRTLKQRCCQQLTPNNILTVDNLEFATMEHDGWTQLPGDSVELAAEQEDLTLSAVVVPTALPPGPRPYPRPPVSLMGLATDPIPWMFCKDKSTTSTDKHYAILIEDQPWEPEIMPYLQDKLQEHTMSGGYDTRFSAQLTSTAENEGGMNDLFKAAVCETVAGIARALGHKVRAAKNQRQDRHGGAEQGEPDYLFKVRGKSLLTGEGKLPSVMRSADAIQPSSHKYLKKWAEQEAFYINEGGHSYGFLTYLHGTFAFARKGEVTYAITRCIPWHKTGDGVIAHILYMVLKQIDIWDGIHDDGIHVPAGTGVQQQQQQLLLQQHALPPGLAAAVGLPVAAVAQPPGPTLQQQQLSQLQQDHMNGATAGFTSPKPPAPAHSTQQVQPAKTPLSTLGSGSATLLRLDGGYLHLDRDALQLTDIVIGMSQSGSVKLGMLSDTWCAVKIADTHNQKPEVRGMKHEIAMFLDDRLKGLQGEVLPYLVGCGYWKDGHLFVVATTYIDGCQKPGTTTRFGVVAAEQALQRLHQQGLLHGDLHRNNVLLRRLSDDKWQAFLIDLGMCHKAEDESDFEDEMKQLHELFRESDTGSGDMTGFEEPEV